MEVVDDTVITYRLAGLEKAVQWVLDKGAGYKIWLLEGPIGSGKTTLVSHVCAALGSQDDISSPTFNIVNEYRSANSEKFFHFDFYRIDTLEEALDLGFEEYLEEGDRLFIEWPEKVKALWPQVFFTLKFSVLGQNERKIALGYSSKD